MLFRVNDKIKSLSPISLIASLLLGLTLSYAEELNIREYQVKAIFLLRFSKFVTYPANTFDSPEAVFNLCVLGDEPFQGTLDNLVKEEKVQKRWVKVNYLRSLANVGDCRTLFISVSEQKQLPRILSYINKKAILTVSDMPDFVIRGGMIQFYTIANKVRFFVDPLTVQEANLVMSARLLQIAQIVKRP